MDRPPRLGWRRIECCRQQRHGQECRMGRAARRKPALAVPLEWMAFQLVMPSFQFLASGQVPNDQTAVVVAGLTARRPPDREDCRHPLAVRRNAGSLDRDRLVPEGIEPEAAQFLTGGDVPDLE